VWFRDLPVKVLHNVSTDKIEKCNKIEDTSDVIQQCLVEPHKSMFEWLLDLAVDVCEHKDANRMDAKNMAILLCPNLFDTNEMPSSQALSFSQSLLRFTEMAIKWRIEYRKTHPFRPADDVPFMKAGTVVPVRGRAELGAMVDAEEEEDEENVD
ncbi:rac GTPase activating protein, partial [Reticulomyxa filosa]